VDRARKVPGVWEPGELAVLKTAESFDMDFLASARDSRWCFDAW